MSSIWNFFAKQTPDGETETGPDGVPLDGAIEVTPSAVTEVAEADPISLTSVKPAAAEPSKVVPPKQRYGIDDAIKLMRTLPVDENVDLVVRVIKRTLESLSVRVPDILEDAAKRQETLRHGISGHEAAIVQLEREIETRRAEIAKLEDDLAETTTVRERLQLAENLQTSIAPKIATTPSMPAVAKKPDATASGRPAPPLPVTRPKLGTEGAKKLEVEPEPEATEVPVESSDLIEKSP